MLQQQLDALRLPRVRELVSELRSYLLHQRVHESHPGNNVEYYLRQSESIGYVVFDLGPTFDKGLEDSHFRLKSGARLSFGITVANNKQYSSLVAYRFHYAHEPTFEVPLVRFDLQKKSHQTPLSELRAHIHLNSRDLRLPCSIIDPFEVLDYLFYVVDPINQAAS